MSWGGVWAGGGRGGDREARKGARAGAFSKATGERFGGSSRLGAAGAGPEAAVVGVRRAHEEVPHPPATAAVLLAAAVEVCRNRLGRVDGHGAEHGRRRRANDGEAFGNAPTVGMVKQDDDALSAISVVVCRADADSEVQQGRVGREHPSHERVHGESRVSRAPESPATNQNCQAVLFRPALFRNITYRGCSL